MWQEEVLRYGDLAGAVMRADEADQKSCDCPDLSRIHHVQVTPTAGVGEVKIKLRRGDQPQWSSSEQQELH